MTTNDDANMHSNKKQAKQPDDKIPSIGTATVSWLALHYLALLALPEIASIRLCGLLFWYTGGFPARTTCPPIKVTTSPLLSLNLLPRRAGPLPRAILAAIAGGLGLITLPHLDFRSSPTFLFMVGQITGKMFDPDRERLCFRSIQSGKLPDWKMLQFKI